MADGIAPGGGSHLCRMRCVQMHMTHLIVLIVDHGQAILGLENLHTKLHGEVKRGRVGRALVGRIGKVFALRRHFSVALHDRGGFRPQDGIVVVADQRVGIANAAGQAPQIAHRPRAARQRLEIEGVAAPSAGEIGNIFRRSGRPNKGCG